MTVVCEFCDRSFTYNYKPESEEKKAASTSASNNNLSTIKTTTSHWLWDSQRNTQTHMGHILIWSIDPFLWLLWICCRTLISNYRIAVHIVFYWLKNSFHFFALIFSPVLRRSLCSSLLCVLCHVFFRRWSDSF